MAFSDEKKKEIIDALTEHGAILPCPRCGTNGWSIVDGYLQNPVMEDIEKVVIGGPWLPAIGVVCNRCGYLAQHAAVSLGIIPAQQTPAQGSASAAESEAPSSGQDESSSAS